MGEGALLLISYGQGADQANLLNLRVIYPVTMRFWGLELFFYHQKESRKQPIFDSTLK